LRGPAGCAPRNDDETVQGLSEVNSVQGRRS
jgi:hypothetical protein